MPTTITRLLAALALLGSFACSPAPAGGEGTTTTTLADGQQQSLEGFCQAAADLDVQDLAAAITENDADAIRTEVEELAESADRLLQEAPEDVRGDAQVLVDAVQELRAELEASDYDPAEADLSVIQDAEVQASARNLADYVAEQC